MVKSSLLKPMNRTKITGLIRLFRPELPFAAGVTVLVGEMVALGGLPSARQTLVGFTCAFLLSSSALILNDVFDLKVDLVNAPERPLPSGMVSVQDAIWLSVVVTLGGLVVALLIGPPVLVFGFFIWVIGFLYNWKFKRSGLPGNLMVAVSVAACFILGGTTVGAPTNGKVWLLALGAFLIDLAEEIAGDAMDMEGDRLLGSQSLALRFGRRTALNISAGIFTLLLLLTPLPLFFGWMGIQYLLAILVADSGLIYFTIKLLRSQSSKEGVSAMRGIYLGFLAGMLVYILGYLLL
jgi:geranylgeranylglycerol-phosphate geranylgeranyltransferase